MFFLRNTLYKTVSIVFSFLILIWQNQLMGMELDSNIITIQTLFTLIKPEGNFLKNKLNKALQKDDKEINTFWELHEMIRVVQFHDPIALEKPHIKMIKKLPTKWKWKQSPLADDSTMVIKKPVDTWYLFIKKCSMVEENRLLEAFILKFGLKNSAVCSAEWSIELPTPEGPQFVPDTTRNEIYLWVKKEAFDNFQRIFNLQIS